MREERGAMSAPEIISMFVLFRSSIEMRLTVLAKPHSHMVTAELSSEDFIHVQ